jgi:hypothetical protein
MALGLNVSKTIPICVSVTGCGCSLFDGASDEWVVLLFDPSNYNKVVNSNRTVIVYYIEI